MLRTQVFRSKLSRARADMLNRESGRIYTETLVTHYRVYRKTGQWLRPGAGEKLNDFYNADRPRVLHAHSIDAAQQGFYKACEAARARRKAGMKEAHYPHQRKMYRTTVWKKTGIRKQDDKLVLALARGQKPVMVRLPTSLRHLPEEAFVEARLVWDRAGQRYNWHIAVEDGQEPAAAPGENIAAVDLGEIHPATVTDGAESAVISCRELRATNQYTNKRLASIQARQSQMIKGSNRWRKIQRRKNRFLAEQAYRRRDLEHKVSREVVNWAIEREVGILVIGDVRDIADGKRLNRKSQQKIGNWSHGRMRQYIKYKAEAAGIEVIDNIDEAYTSQTCPHCGSRHKPRGRVYSCPACGLVAHRDVVGAANILSRFIYGEVAQILPPEPKYRHPFLTGKRSPPDTGQVARSALREAARLQS